MKKLRRKIIRYTTTITDMLYYLMPIELLLALLCLLSLVGIGIVNQLSIIITWDVWRQIRDGLRMGQSMLVQIIVIIIMIYLLAHVFLCFIWIKEDHLLNFFCTINQLRKIRKQMQSRLSEDISKEYESIIHSIRCIVTYDQILVIIPPAETSEVCTILQEKISFLYNYLSRNYRKLYVFSPPDSTSFNYVIKGERKYHI